MPALSDPPPKVSVLVPAYNAAATLAATLDSVRQQTFTDWELVVVDDGSTDTTAEVARACQDPRIRLIRQTNTGLAGARNQGFAQARGEFFAILDADDLARPDRLAMQVAFMEDHPQVDLCFTAFESFDAHGPLPESFSTQYYPVLQREGYRWDRLFTHHARWSPAPGSTEIPVYAGRVYAALAHGNFVHPPTVMLRRRLWEATGPFDTSIRNLTDWDWLVRAARQGDFGYLEHVGIDYRRHSAQMSGPVHTEQLARDLIEVNERLCRADPALYSADRHQFNADLRDFHYTLANILANRPGRTPESLNCLRRSLAYGWPGLGRLAFVLAKTFTPARALGAAKSLLRTVRPARG